jgi:hypothetical protein
MLADEHDGEAGLDAARLELLDAVGDFVKDLGRDDLAIEDAGCHERQSSVGRR